MGVTMEGWEPTIHRPGEEVAEIIILENDDPHGILELNVTKVSHTFKAECWRILQEE